MLGASATPEQVSTQAPPAQPPAQPAGQPPPDGQAQQPPKPVFRTGAALVRVDVAVLDRKGVPVTSLTAADFELEGGRRRAGNPHLSVRARTPASPTKTTICR